MARWREASPGQFEINLHHTDNVLDACDDALALKRLVRLMAGEATKMHATFMAKPYEEHAGSGMHIHISMLNNKGKTCWWTAMGKTLRCLQTRAGRDDRSDAGLDGGLLAPNVNSYRRFQPGMYVPTQASWGHNSPQPSRCVFRAASGRTTAWSIASRGRTPTRIW